MHLRSVCLCFCSFFLRCTFLISDSEALFGASSVRDDPDYQDPSVCGMAMRKGYPCEEYNVTSYDNQFLLTIWRIRRQNYTVLDPPVLMVPPLLTTAGIYAFDTENKSIAYVLAKEGFDVWICNIRGTTYGKTLVDGSVARPGNPSHWNHTIYEYAKYDAPAHLDFVLEKTKFSKLFIVAMSQGNPTVFHMLSMMPSYNDKVIAMTSLSPFMTVRYMKEPVIKMLLSMLNRGSPLARLVGWEEFLPAFPRTTSLAATLCDMVEQAYANGYENGSIAKGFMRALDLTIGRLVPRTVCPNVGNLFMFLGTDYINVSRIPIYLQHYPGGTSRSNLEYYNQLRVQDHDTVTPFDWRRVTWNRRWWFGNGQHPNVQHYRQETPPKLHGENIKLNILVVYSSGDTFVPPEEVRHTMKWLSNSNITEYFIDDPKFTHFQFIANIKPNTLNADIANYFKSFSTENIYTKK